MRELVLGVLGLIVTFGVSASAQPRPSLYALMTLVVAAALAFLVPRCAPSNQERTEGL